MLPALIDQRIAATKVQFDVDEPSMKKVKSKISELFSSLGRWGMVVFWKWIETEDEETGEKKEVPFLR